MSTSIALIDIYNVLALPLVLLSEIKQAHVNEIMNYK
jgi:hypothetical protein